MSDATSIPEGTYAIVELFGHVKLIGRIEEVDRFGSKMLQIEPIFAGQMLAPVLRGGGAIYGLTEISGAKAFELAPRRSWSIPDSIRAIVPPKLLEEPAWLKPAAENAPDADPDDGGDEEAPEPGETDDGDDSGYTASATSA